ncbi:nucleotidyltransferase family protein [Jiangella asiatica]|uniref:Nucleotidyltransferase family protein n=1 Tax=Jiangella asiatica TaxID=2530372 RepID=A0A4R5C5P9_9ACTN|nr:nucleotidyltransferase family protein [Jiangella asiatica]TDD94335.1 nucleotidyltransferase family protein [Jiangella asiatica]
MSAEPSAGPAGLVLAAGSGSRFGAPKALVELEGERLVDRAVRLLGAACRPVVVVSGAVSLTVPGAIVVHNPDWATGMGSSLRTGLRALSGAGFERIGAVVVALVDQPWVGPEAVSRLCAAWIDDGARVAVATYDGRRGNPVLLDRSVWPEVMAAATGDVGARAFIVARPDLVTTVPCDGTGRPDDVDTPSDLPAD